MTAEWTDLFEQVRQNRAGRLEWVNEKLGAFVRAYDRYVIAQGGTDQSEYDAACAELDREYEALDGLGADRP